MQLALFDFDHTITTRDTYSRFVRSIATHEQVAHAKWTIGPWWLGYRIGLLTAAGIRARVTQVAFGDRDEADITASAIRYGDDVLPGLMRTEMLQRITWHQGRSHQIAIVSGSLDIYLRPWCEALGLDLICNRLESDGGRLTGRYAGRDIGPHKAAEIKARYDLPRYERIHAYGDSREDQPMLALAQERWYRGKRIA